VCGYICKYLLPLFGMSKNYKPACRQAGFKILRVVFRKLCYSR
jgi:hypothetical protein